MRHSASIRNAIVLVAVGSTATLFAQNVPYEKYKLDNGMTVILHEDHSLPVVGINTWYHVGSKDEHTGRSGFAHLFEHLMFMGTERVPGNKFDTLMEAGGGSNNASTSSDRTNYFSSGPAALLPTLLWLDADRLEDLGRTMDKEKLDKQRDVVRNERRQSYENRPYGKAELVIQEMMYPVGHIYHIPVIGTHEDLEAATVADVKDFFATNYVPNNASLVVAGDFDSKQIKPLIAQLLGTIARGGDPVHRSAEPVKLSSVQRTTMLDKVQLPMVAIAYHSPGTMTDGDAEMDLVAAILTQGKTSRLYKRLVYDDQIAAEVNAYQDNQQYGSMFRIDVLANPDADLDRIEREVDEEVAKLLEKGPTSEELEQRKATIELTMLERLQTVDAKADQLNAYEYYWGEPNSFKRDLDRYRTAKVDKVQKWAKQVLTPNARVIMRVLPEEPERVASARDEQPGAGVAPVFKPLAPQSFKLANGVPVMLWSKKELPLVDVLISFRTGGIISENATSGAVYLAAEMLDEGAGELNALQFGDRMQSLGAEFDTGADHESVTLSLTALKRNFEPAIALVADAARKPRFETAEWERVKKLHLEDLKQQEDQPTIVASRVAARAYFGDAHPYSRSAMGVPDTVEKLGLDDVKAKYRALVRPEFMSVLIAGDVNVDEAKSALDRLFGDWKTDAKTDTKQAEFPVTKHDKMELVLVDRPDAVQTVVYFIMPGPKYSDEKRVTYRLINTILGGSFTSRLNMNLRENHGYTYGARSSFIMRPLLGYVTAASSVRADVTGESLKEFLNELNGIRGGTISDEETTKARETLRTDVIQAFAGLGGIVREAAERSAAGLPFETLEKDMAAMQSAGTPQLNGLAGSSIPYDKGVLVLVGDKGKILEQIKDLNLPKPVEVSVRGDRLGS